MLQKKYSANDLTLDIHNLYKEYNMCEYYHECCELMKEYATEDVKLEIEQAFKHTNNVQVLHQSIVEFVDRTNMSPEVAEEFINKTITVQEKYKFASYSKKCHSLRKKFLKERNEYLRNNIRFISLKKNKSEADLPYNVNNFHDLILSKWLDDIIEQTNPEPINITYEDLTGKIETITVKYKPDSFSEIDMSIETRPIDKFSGMGIFDSFMLHAFFDIISNKWKYVPISLICSVSGKYVDEIFNNNKQQKDIEDDDGTSIFGD